MSGTILHEFQGRGSEQAKSSGSFLSHEDRNKLENTRNFQKLQVLEKNQRRKRVMFWIG